MQGHGTHQVVVSGSVPGDVMWDSQWTKQHWSKHSDPLPSSFYHSLSLSLADPASAWWSAYSQSLTLPALWPHKGLAYLLVIYEHTALWGIWWTAWLKLCCSARLSTTTWNWVLLSAVRSSWIQYSKWMELTLLPQPTLLIGIEERVHKVIAIILGDLEGLSLYTLIQALQNRMVPSQLSHTPGLANHITILLPFQLPTEKLRYILNLCNMHLSNFFPKTHIQKLDES